MERGRFSLLLRPDRALQLRRHNPETIAEFWEAQAEAQSIPNTGMAVINDIGNLADIHPANKQEVGRRLALWALAKTYGGTEVIYSGPTFKSMKVEGDTARSSLTMRAAGWRAATGNPCLVRDH